jgi:hypothetical protein
MFGYLLIILLITGKNNRIARINSSVDSTVQASSICTNTIPNFLLISSTLISLTQSLSTGLDRIASNSSLDANWLYGRYGISSDIYYKYDCFIFLYYTNVKIRPNKESGFVFLLLTLEKNQNWNMA